MPGHQQRVAFSGVLFLVGAISLAFTPQSLGLKMAAVGDFGVDDQYEKKVADMIAGWTDVTEVLALGDCNYDIGDAATMDRKVGKYYHQFISPYLGNATLNGPGSSTGNHFWPIAGNHDWGNTCGDYKTGCTCTSTTDNNLVPYLAYMPVNNQRYYTQVFDSGLVQIFALSSDCNEPDGTGSGSTQYTWLYNQLTSSTATWKIVMLHHAPFSSCTSHGSITRLQWPFKQWGAHLTLSGHDHVYERIVDATGFPYIVNGIGGRSINSFSATPVTGSAVRYNLVHGAQHIEANTTTISLRFYAATNPSDPYASLIDCYAINKVAVGSVLYSDCMPSSQPGAWYSVITGAPGNNAAGTAGNMAWSYSSDSTLSSLTVTSADTSTWSVGKSRFGYGPDHVYNTLLPAAGTSLEHYFRTTFCLSAARMAWLAGQSLSLRVMADNGADVWINGVKMLSDAVSNHDPVYWNNIVNIAGNNAAFVQGVNNITAYVSNSASSSDAGFDLDLMYFALANADANIEVPDPVMGALATAASSSSINVAWTKPVCDGSSFITSYSLTINPLPGVTVSDVTVTNPFQPTYSKDITGLAPCTTYTVTIKALNAAGQSVGTTTAVTTTGCATVVDCVGAWTELTTCSATCGGGTQSSTYIISVPGAYGGTNCSFTNGTANVTACNTQACPPAPTEYSLLTGAIASNSGTTRPNIYWRYVTTNSINSKWMQRTFDASTWLVGRTRFGYGPGWTYTTTLPAAGPTGTTTNTKHYFRTSFCLSTTRKTWLASKALSLKVFADNGADVFINGVKLVTDATANHGPVYWNNAVTVAGNNAALIAGVNWIAVYLSNTAASSDAGFDLDLQYNATAPNTEAPGAVTGTSATVLNSSSIRVAWTKPACDGSSFITSYSLITSPAVTVPDIPVANAFTTTYTSTITGLASCTTYTVKIKASNAAGSSTGVSVTTTTTCPRVRRSSRVMP